MTLFAHYARNTSYKSRKASTRKQFENFGPGPARPQWSPAMVDRMCDLIADGNSQAEAARIMGVTRGAVAGQFGRIRAAYGWQAA